MTDFKPAVDLSPYADDAPLVNAISLEFRFPIVSTAFPRWNYITSVVAPSTWRPFVMPTDDELRMVGGFHEAYCDHWYRPGFREHMRKSHPFDIDGGANGRILAKYENGGWCFRRASWTLSDMQPPSDGEPVALPSLLDQINTVAGKPSESWAAWKSAHVEIFGGSSDHCI